MGLGVVAFLAVVGVVAFLGLNKSSGPTDQSTSQTTESDSSMAMNENGGEMVSGSFLDLLKLGRSYTCTFAYQDETGNRTEGEVFVATGGEMLAGDFMFYGADGTQYDGGVVRDGQYNYVWTSQFGGVKTPVTPDDESLFGGAGDESTNEGGLNDDVNTDFDCKSWRVDNSKFIPPADVEFVDFSQQMQEMEEMADTIEGVDCSACDGLPDGDIQDQCFAALGC